MGTQQLLTIGGIVIFTLFTLTQYNSQKSQSVNTYFNETFVIASELGSSLIEEIQAKAFDETTTINAVDTIINLTSSTFLGKDSGEGSLILNQKGFDESITFDDIDDYDGFKREYSHKLYGLFSTIVEVYYVKFATPSSKSISRTFAKRVDVSISNSYLSSDLTNNIDTLKLSSILTY